MYDNFTKNRLFLKIFLREGERDSLIKEFLRKYILIESINTAFSR